MRLLHSVNAGPDEAPDAAVAAPSAARLAAEEAFSERPRGEVPPVVIVRKSRLLPPDAALGEAPAESDSEPTPLADATPRSARVFRVVAAEPAEPAAAEAETDQPLLVVPRHERDHIRRPGPVVSIVPPRPAPAVRPVESLATLVQMLAGVDAVLRDAQRARDWRCNA